MKMLIGFSPVLALVVLLFGATSLLQADDTLELRNGSSLKGIYEGGTPDVIHFNFNGTTQAYSRNDVASLTLAQTVPGRPTGSASGSAATTASTPTPVADSGLTIPAGTTLVASLQQAVNSGKMKPGQTFPALLVSDLRINDQVVLPAGTPLQGQIVDAKSAGRLRKNAELNFTISAIQYRGQLVPVRTTTQQQASDSKTGREVVGGAARGAALGAIVGAITGDAGEGAAAGAAAGGAGGLISKGDDVEYSAGSVLGFTLESPVKL